MFKEENLLKLLIAIVVLLILGAISLPLALDSNMGLVKKKEENGIIIKDEDSEIETIEDVNENEQI